MKNLIIIIAAIALFSCKKNEDYKKDEWKSKGVNFSVYTPDSTKFADDGWVTGIYIFKDEQHYKNHTENYKLVNGYPVDNYPPLYFYNGNPLDIVGMPSSTYFVAVYVSSGNNHPKAHFTNKSLTYNADVSQGYTFFKLYLERGIYLNGQLTF